MSKQYPGGIISKTPVTPSGPYSTDSASGIWTLDQQAYWRKLGQWPTAGNPAPDAQFNYVTMLLHGDGTNGAQNNTFLDSSTNNFTITRNGNTTQGSFSPYGSNWSTNFDGSTSSLTAPYIALSSNFTIECWAYANSLGGSRGLVGMSKANDVSNIVIRADGTNLEFWVDGYNYITTATSVLSVGNWFHVALVRNGSTNTLYLNGVSVASSTRTPVQASSPITTIGRSYEVYSTGELWNGYISNVRIGTTAVYTANFTPSTTPLTAITGTVLLTCADNRFIDDSTNNYTITTVGTPSVQRFNPFGASTAYSTSVIGGSGYFDGSGDYLSIPDNAAFTLGSGDWCSEGWVYATYYPTYARLWGQGVAGGPSNSSVDLFMLTGSATSAPVQLNVRTKVAGSGNDYITAALPINQWYHIAVYRISGTIYIGINGVVSVVRTTSGSMDDSTANYCIGANSTGSGGEFWQGYISDQRLVVGSAVYTSSNFTPPTAPLTAISGTQLLAKTINGAIFDNAMMNDLETVANAQISTSVVKYGTGSLAFDGTGDSISTAWKPNLELGSGDFTIEFWIYPIGGNSLFAWSLDWHYAMSWNYGGATSNRVGVWASTNGSSWNIFNADGGGNGVSTGTLNPNSWSHIAWVRNGSSWALYINGVSAWTGTSSSTIYSRQDNFRIGGPWPAGGPADFNGYIDDFRITKGYARYTANFTPPTAAFSNFGPT